MVKLTVVKGRGKKTFDVRLERHEGRFYFISPPFSMKDEITCMRGAKWHGSDDPPRIAWSVLDCPRNRFQLNYMAGAPVYSPWDAPLIEHKFDRPLKKHQELMVNFALTRHYCILAASPGTGKTLVGIETIERSDQKDWIWVAPKSGLKALERELYKWGLDRSINLRVMNYEKLLDMVQYEWPSNKQVPGGIIFDESQRLKNETAKRTIAAQAVADAIREKYGMAGFAMPMSGTTQAKSPVDVWSQAEVAYPGFLREGSQRSFEKRLALFTEKGDSVGGTYLSKDCWYDDERKCHKCGQFKEGHPSDHRWIRSINEVALVAERMKGLQLIIRKDVLELPEKKYREIVVKPNASTIRVAKAMANAAPSTITGLNWLRQLSDGFAYSMVAGEETTCKVCNGTSQAEQPILLNPEETDNSKQEFEMVLAECLACNGTGFSESVVRQTKRVACPKDDVVRELLDENDEQGRLVIFAGFQGSIDRCTDLCLAKGWSVVKIDGRGWFVHSPFEKNIKVDPLDFWANRSNERVVVVAHPQSGGTGLTLVEARMAIFFSNTFSADERIQAGDRIHRIGADMNLGVEIVDIIHLETDRLVKDTLDSNQKLELMSLGLLSKALE